MNGKVLAKSLGDSTAPLEEGSPEPSTRGLANTASSNESSLKAKLEEESGQGEAEKKAAQLSSTPQQAVNSPASSRSSSAPEPLQVRWQVREISAAMPQVIEWVSVRHGFAVATNDHHLSIRLPAADVPQFLQQLSTNPPPAPDATQPIWVTISLEIVLSP